MTRYSNQSKVFRSVLKPSMATVLVTALAFAAPVSAVEPQADFIFDMLGTTVCAFPPGDFELVDYRELVDANPDAPLARGAVEGDLNGRIAGGAGYGDDGSGSYMFAMQGFLLDKDDDATLLCSVLAHVGKKTGEGPVSGAIVGEAELDDAKDGDFLGVFKLVRSDNEGGSQTWATGTVTGGTLQLDAVEGEEVAGTLALEGSYTPVGSDVSHPLSMTVDIPLAENVINGVWTLKRN